MFENLRIVCTPSESNIAVNVMWEWKFDGTGPLPSCNVFCCTIPENQLLQDAIFSQDEIVTWMTRTMLDILTPQTRASNIEAFHMNPANKERCQFNTYQLTSGGSTHDSKVLHFPVSDMNKVFIVCVYDNDGNFDYSVFAPDIGGKISYTCEEPRGGFMKLFGGKSKGGRKLIFSDSGNKRRVMVTSYNGADVYTVIPNGTSYNIDSDFDINSIKDVVYLSTLIGG